MIYFNLNKYLPPIVKDIKDLQQINEVASMELRRLMIKGIQVLNNFFLETCDLETIEQWEQILNIDGSNTDTIEERRQRVMLQLNLMVPYTIESLKSKLNSIIGKEGYQLIIDYNQQTYLIIVFQNEGVNQKTIKLIENLMLSMAPAHLQGEVSLGNIIETNNTEYYGIATSQSNIYDIEFIV